MIAHENARVSDNIWRRLAEASAAALSAVSDSIAAVERVTLAILVAAITILILTNVATRYAGQAVFWIDEAAVYLMVVMCFVGASLLLRSRLTFAVTFLIDAAGPARRRRIDSALAVVGALYAAFLCWTAWRLFDPWTLAGAGFNIASFQSRTGNFVYSDPTQTLGLPRFVFFLVMPVFAVTSLVHCLTNFVEEIGWIARREEAAGVTDMG